MNETTTIDLLSETAALLDVLAESLMTNELSSRHFLATTIKERIEAVIGRMREGG